MQKFSKYEEQFSLQEYEFFQTLEMHMRVEFPPLCGRDHLSFRSFYAPVKVRLLALGF